MKERLLSIASGGRRKKGVALVCAAALVTSAGAAACSLGAAEEPCRLNGIFDREGYTLQGAGEYVAGADADGSFAVERSSRGGEALPAWGMIVSPVDPDTWGWEGGMEDFFAPMVTTYGVELSDDDGSPVLPAEAVSLTAAQVQYMGEEPWTENQWPLYAYEVLVERADGRAELHTFYMMIPVHDLWFDLSQMSREEAERVRDTLVLGHDRTVSPDRSRMITITPAGTGFLLYDTSGGHPSAVGQVSHSGGFPGGVISDPLWSPDSRRVAVTVSNGSRKSFSFPIGPFYPEMAVSEGVAEATYAVLDPEYWLKTNVAGFPQCIPLAWSEDGLSLQYSWAWVDTENQLHQGTAWYCFDENDRFTEIRDVVETSSVPLSERSPIGNEAFPGYDGETSWSWGGDYRIELAPDEQGVFTFCLVRDGARVPFQQLPADYGPKLRYPYSGLVETRPFTGVLGHDGFVLTYGLETQAMPVEYYLINRDGAPELLAVCGGQVWERDTDGDGDCEVLSLRSDAARLYRWHGGRLEAADVASAAQAKVDFPVVGVDVEEWEPGGPLILRCYPEGANIAGYTPVEVPLDGLDFQPV